MSVDPTQIEKWFKVANFTLGLLIVISQLIWYMAYNTFSRDLLLFGGGLLGFTGFITFGRNGKGNGKEGNGRT